MRVTQDLRMGDDQNIVYLSVIDELEAILLERLPHHVETVEGLIDDEILLQILFVGKAFADLLQGHDKDIVLLLCVLGGISASEVFAGRRPQKVLVNQAIQALAFCEQTLGFQFIFF